MPDIEQIDPAHSVRYYRHEEVAAREQAVDYFARFHEEAERILGAGLEGSGAPGAKI